MRINLNEILARDDYKRMTENLKSITEEVARAIHKKMDELEIEDNTDFDNGEIGVDDVVVRVITVNSNSGFNRSFLGIKRYQEGDNHAYYASLEDINSTYYFLWRLQRSNLWSNQQGGSCLLECFCKINQRAW